MERSSPYPPDPDRLDHDSLHRNGNYSLNSYSTVDANHKTNFSESRPRSYGNEHYSTNAYQVNQNFHYGYPTSFTPDAHRSPYESVPYTDSLNSMDRPDLYRPRSADPSHTFGHFDYASHHSAAHFRSGYHDDANYRPIRDQYFTGDSKHIISEPKTNYPLYEEARLTFQERPYSTNSAAIPEYSSKTSDISPELLNSSDLRSPHSIPASLAPRDMDLSLLETDSKKVPETVFDIPVDRPRESLPPVGDLQTGGESLIDTDPLDLRKTESWNDAGAYSTENTDCAAAISTEFDKESASSLLKKTDLGVMVDQTKTNNPESVGGVLTNQITPDNIQQSPNKTMDTVNVNSVVLPNKDEAAGNSDKIWKTEPIPAEEPEVEIIGKKKKAVVEAEMKIIQQKEAQKLSDAANISPGEKLSSRRKSKTPVKDSETKLNRSKTDEEDDESEEEDDDDDDDDEVFHCGFCGEIFHDEDLLVKHDCQNEEIDSEDSEDNEDEDEEEEEEELTSTVESTPSTPKKIAVKKEESDTPVRRSARKNKAQIHIKEVEEDEEESDPYICGECGQTFDKERLLLRHVKTHRNSDIEDYVETETATPSRYATRSRINRPKRKASKRKSYDYVVEESYTETPTRSKRKKDPLIKIKEPKVPEDTRKYGCAICGEISTGRDNITQHLIAHCTEMSGDDKVWNCEYCEKTFSDENFLDRHVDVHELNGDQKIVKIEPVKKKDLKKEASIVKVKKYECATCNKVFKLKNELRIHERGHNETRKYLCVVCGEESTGKDAYLKHKKTHKTPKSYACEECGDMFNLRSLLNQHMKSHGLKTSFDCEQCNRSFFSAGHLAIHKKGHKHAGTKKHRCQECGYQVYSEAKLMEHLESHINQDPFMCPFCGKLFMKKSTFTKHKKKHSGQNMCDVCGKAFSHKSGLDRHYTTHSGEKSYKCMYCDKSFSQQSNLSTHLRQHSGEKPFMCEICAHSFTNKCSLVRHMTKHTEGESEMQAASLARQGAVSGLNNINIPLPPLPNSISHSMYALNQFQF